MTTFNTIDELLDILNKNPRLLEAVRSKILTDELMKLPLGFAGFEKTTNARLDEHGVRLGSIDTRLDGIDGRLDQHGRRLDGIGGNVSDLKGHHTIQDARSNADYLAAEMGLDWTRTLRKIDILHIWQAAERNGLTEGISAGNRRSFLDADIIADAIDSQGNECFIAIEASYTVQTRDADRAIRNASYLTRFTGKASYMAVTGVSKLEEVNDIVGEENPQAFDATQESIVFWLELSDIESPD